MVYSGWRPCSLSKSAMMLSMFSCHSLSSSCAQHIHSDLFTHDLLISGNDIILALQILRPIMCPPNQ